MVHLHPYRHERWKDVPSNGFQSRTDATMDVYLYEEIRIEVVATRELKPRSLRVHSVGCRWLGREGQGEHDSRSLGLIGGWVVCSGFFFFF